MTWLQLAIVGDAVINETTVKPLKAALDGLAEISVRGNDPPGAWLRYTINDVARMKRVRNLVEENGFKFTGLTDVNHGHTQHLPTQSSQQTRPSTSTGNGSTGQGPRKKKKKQKNTGGDWWNSL